MERTEAHRTPSRRVAAGAPTNRRPGTRICHCLECGEEFEGGPTAEFCSDRHRKKFHNRRMQRGAEMYDLVMTMRFNRPLAAAMGLWTILSRLASEARQEDKDLRDGRRSWRRPKDVIEAKPYLRATGRGRI